MKIATLLIAILLNSIGYAQLTDKTIYVEAGTDTNLVNYAQELAAYLQQIEGNTYAINTSGSYSGTGILLALRTVTSNISPADNTTLSRLNGEGFLLDASTTRIKIIGNHHKAVSHGMFAFLKKLNCYFLTPSPDWTIIPNNPTWSLTLKEFDAPDYISRNFWYSNGDGDGYGNVMTQNAIDRRLFFRATQQGSIGTVQVGHSYQDDIAEAPAQFQAHPEWFGTDETDYQYTWQDYVNNGSNGDGIILEYSDMNLANLMLQHRISWLQQYQQEDPDEFMITMEPNDGSHPSYTAASQALGNMADQVLNLANYVANNITTTIPNAQIAIYCYGGSLEAPINTTPASNIYGEMAMAFNGTDKSFNEMANNWIASGLSKFGVYEYAGEYQWDLGLPHCQNTVSLKEMKERIPYAKNNWNAMAFTAESQANWGRGGPAYYVARKLMWDINANADMLYDEYLNKAFGNAAATMKLLYQDWETYYGYLQPTDLDHIMLNKWLVLINQALGQVQQGTPEYKRVEDVYAYIHLTILTKEYFDVERVASNTNDTTAARAAAIPVLEFAYRLRHRQMIQFWAFQLRFIWERPLLWDAPDYIPGWDFFNMDTNPTLWMSNGNDFSSSELSSLLSQDLNDYPVDPLVKNYSTDLIPLYPNLQPSLFTQQVEQMDTVYHYGVTGFSQWYFYSENDHNENMYIIKSNNRHNEGFDCEINHLLIEKMSDNSVILDQTPAVSYQSGELDTDTINNLSLNHGLYRMELENEGSDQNEYFLQFETPHRYVVETSHKNRLSTLALQAENPNVPNCESMYFYVPADIDTLYLHHGYYFSIKAPSWSDPVNYDWTTIGFLKIPITNVMDKDTLWQLDCNGTSEENFYLLNVPPYLSNSPENMLVPESGPLSISEDDKIDFGLYPNPAKDVVTIKSANNITSIDVLNINGQLISTKKINSKNYQLSVSNLSSGIYFIKVHFNNTKTVKKIIIE